MSCPSTNAHGKRPPDFRADDCRPGIAVKSLCTRKGYDDGRWVQGAGQYRYVWPSELDLMARLAGLRLEHRWAGWDRSPFTAESAGQVAVYRKQHDV